jgi:hypothetical protein
MLFFMLIVSNAPVVPNRLGEVPWEAGEFSHLLTGGRMGTWGGGSHGCPTPSKHDGAGLKPLAPGAIRSESNTWMIQVQVPGRVHRSRIWVGIDFALKGVEVSVIFFETHLRFQFMEAGVNIVGVTEAALL